MFTFLNFIRMPNTMCQCRDMRLVPMIKCKLLIFAVCLNINTKERIVSSKTVWLNKVHQATKTACTNSGLNSMDTSINLRISFCLGHYAIIHILQCDDIYRVTITISCHLLTMKIFIHQPHDD